MTARAARSAALRRVRGQEPALTGAQDLRYSPAERADGPFETLPARPHDRARAEALPVRPADRAQTRTLPVQPHGERPPRMERAPRAHHEERTPNRRRTCS